MTMGFIVRVEHDGGGWTLTLLELATGERRSFPGFDACFAALRETAERRLPAARRGHHEPDDGFRGDEASGRTAGAAADDSPGRGGRGPA